MSGGSQITTTEPWAKQQEYLTKGFERAEGLYGQGMPAYYPGQTLAGFDPEQQRAQASMLNYGRGERVGAMQSGAERALLSKLGGQTPFTDQQTSDLLAGKVNTGAGTPYGDLADVYGQQYASQLSKQMPGIRQQMVQYQPGGGSRGDIVQGMAEAAASKNLATNLAQMYGGAYQQAQGQRFPMAQMGIGQQTAGMGAYPSIMGAPMGMYGAMADVGAQRRGLSQEQINRDMQKYQYEAGAPQTALQNYLASVTGDYGSVVTAPGKDYTGNILGALLGGIG
jgi:hypothetical protein